MLRYRRFICPVALFIVICGIIVMADAGHKNLFFSFVKKHRYADKIGHLLMYGLLAFFTNIALNFKTTGFGWFRVQTGALMVLSFSVLEEMSQYFLPTRDFELKDIAANVVGITLFTLLSLAYREIVRRFFRSPGKK